MTHTNTVSTSGDFYHKPTGLNPHSNSSDSECLERFLKENKILKEKVNQLEQENIKLKKSLFELAIQRNNTSSNGNGGSGGNGLLSNTFHWGSNLSLDQLFLNNNNQQTINNNQLNINNTSNTQGNTQNNNNNNIDFNKLQFINSNTSGGGNNSIGKSLQSNSLAAGGNYQNKKFKLKQNIKAHNGAIYTLNYNKSSNLLCTGGLDKTLKLWKTNEDLQTYELQQTLKDQNSSISHLEFSPHQNCLSSTSLDYLINIYDTQETKLINSTKLNNSGLPLFNCFNKSDPNRLFISTSRGEIIEKDFRSSSLIPRFKRNGLKLNSLVSRQGFENYLFFGNELGNLEVFDDRINKSIELPLNNEGSGGYQSNLNGFNDNPLLTHLTSPSNAPDSSLLALNLTNHTNSIVDLTYTGQLTDDLNPSNWQLSNIKNYSGYENSYASIRCSMVLDDSDCWFATGSSDGIIYLNCNRIDKLSSPNLTHNQPNEILIQDQLNQNMTRIYDVQFKPNLISGLEFASVGCDGHLRIWSQ